MSPRDLLQSWKDKVEVDNQFRENPIIMQLHQDGKKHCATIAIPIEGNGVRIIEVCATDWGIADALIIGA